MNDLDRISKLWEVADSQGMLKRGNKPESIGVLCGLTDIAPSDFERFFKRVRAKHLMDKIEFSFGNEKAIYYVLRVIKVRNDFICD